MSESHMCMHLWYFFLETVWTMSTKNGCTCTREVDAIDAKQQFSIAKETSILPRLSIDERLWKREYFSAQRGDAAHSDPVVPPRVDASHSAPVLSRGKLCASLWFK